MSVEHAFGVVHVPILLPQLSIVFVVFEALSATFLDGFVDTLCLAMVPMVRKG